MIDLPFEEPPKPPPIDIEPMRRELGLEQCKLRPFDHQVIGINALVLHPFFALFDEMGAGKTLQALVAAQILFLRGIIHRVIIVSPAAVRGVWFDTELGEIRKHLFLPNYKVSLYHSKSKTWTDDYNSTVPGLEFIVTNYEFIGRSGERLKQLLPLCDSKTLLILDESTAVKSRGAAQTKACFAIRDKCGRVVLLNGTPIANNPLDLFSQGNILHRSVHGYKYITHFRSAYAIMKSGVNFPMIIGWRNLEDLQQKFAPYVLRRLKEDCLDLPEKLPPVTLEVELTEETWKIYKEMRDHLVAWLGDSSVSIAGQAIVKIMRLAQITSGFLGGLEEEINEEELDLLNAQDQQRTSFINDVNPVPPKWAKFTGPIQEIGREKLDFTLDWWKQRLAGEERFKLIVFSRFKPEILRFIEEVRQTGPPSVHLGLLTGGQKPADREATLRLLDPRTSPDAPVLAGGTYGTGAKGVTLTAAHTIFNMSTDYSLEKMLQSGDRIHRMSQVHACSFFDLAAVGPKGQKTIDHTIIKQRRGKEDLAIWTQAPWTSRVREVWAEKLREE
jgi:SNF2 family DNA or RNA helicase